MIFDRLFRAEAESHQRILTSEQLARAIGYGSSTAAGVNVTPDRAMRLAAVFICTKILAESVGQLPLDLFQRKGKSKVDAVDHPLYSLLKVAPNEYQTAQEWKEWLAACLALRGNAYSHIIRRRPGGPVIELNPLRPEAVTPKQDPATGAVTYAVAPADGSTQMLTPDEVLHVKLFTLDGVNGLSPIGYARETIGLGIAAERHGAGLFGRNATPGGVLSFPKTLSEPAAKRLRDSWDERHAGADNSQRTAVLEEGGEWKSITMPSKDAQWLEGRKFQRTEIFGFYRVPPHMGGDLERATFSNIEQSSLDFVVHTLMPWLTRIEGRIALQLLSKDERKEFFAKFQVGALLRGDMAARADFYSKQIQNGAISPNEIRSLEDMDPREGGDVFLQPANMIISDGKPPKKPDPAPPPEPPPPSDG